MFYLLFTSYYYLIISTFLFLSLLLFLQYIKENLFNTNSAAAAAVTAAY